MLIAIITSAAVLATGCDKFLQEKSDGKLVVPQTLADLQAMLDNSAIRTVSYCSLGETSADDYYLPQATYDGLAEHLRRQYTWQPDELFARSGLNEWLSTYQAVYACSSVLESLEDIQRTAGNREQWDSVKGQALALRALRYLDALLVWAPAYDESSAETDLGIVLRNRADFNERSERASVQICYDQVINDFQQAAALLPIININASRPSKSMAYGALARTHLFMRQYWQAGIYADSCLSLRDVLLDYNAFNERANQTFPAYFNEEVIFLAQIGSGSLASSQPRIPDSLVRAYDSNDLRKTLFFRLDNAGLWQFKGQYTGTATMSSSLTTAEMLLIRAECLIRAGNVQAGLDAVNILGQKRWREGSYRQVTGLPAPQALDYVFAERRRELIRRALRWPDIKRLNKEGMGISLHRDVSGEHYRLRANDPRFAIALPEEILELSGMPQNPR
ncbi:RagB/SusD family nutrient uptake outer membrane protein [Sphingobacterium corticis]|uniref:RagB/SusD family nutrient uptake outer membrane protein n=1 Tax=Sphingobacterium corticis TaxID=1812823 RepID=A0ABW5NIU9_9SPHI